MEDLIICMMYWFLFSFVFFIAHVMLYNLLEGTLKFEGIPTTAYEGLGILTFINKCTTGSWASLFFCHCQYPSCAVPGMFSCWPKHVRHRLCMTLGLWGILGSPRITMFVNRCVNGNRHFNAVIFQAHIQNKYWTFPSDLSATTQNRIYHFLFSLFIFHYFLFQYRMQIMAMSVSLK